MATCILWTDQTSEEIHQIEFDATPVFDGSHTVELTENTVERGINTTDHVRQKPFTAKIEVVITNTPTRQIADNADGVTWDFRSKDLEVNGEQTSITVWAPSGEYTRTVNVYERLLELQQNAELFTMQTTIRDYPNLILVNISLNRTPQKGKALYFSLEFQEIRFGRTEVVDLPAPDPRSARPRQNQGVQQAEVGSSDTVLVQAKDAYQRDGWQGVQRLITGG